VPGTRAQLTARAHLRVPVVDEMILKLVAGNPQGRIAAKKPFAYFASLQSRP